MSGLLKKLAGLSGAKKIISDSQIHSGKNDDQEFEQQEENDEDNFIQNLSTSDEESPDSQNWLDEEEEGQLSIDVFQDSENIIVKSTIAGVKPEDIDISVNNDMLTIRGKREMQEKIDEEDYILRECYWGNFSRTVILPVEVEADKIEASLESGVLTVRLPKAKNAKKISIKVKEI